MRRIWIEAVRVINKKLGEVLKEKSCKVFAADPVVIYNICDGKFLCHGDLSFKLPDKLKMRGFHEVKRDNTQGPEHPYLFDKDDGAGEDIAPFEDKIKQFHDKLRERKLPYFKIGHVI